MAAKLCSDMDATESTFLLDEESAITTIHTDGREGRGEGVSVPQAALMFTMSIAGAGVLGISGAIAQSGGLVSVVAILSIAVLTKRSYDLLISLSIDTDGVEGSYERLGEIAMDAPGRVAVFASKFTYTFFTLVVHIKIVKDNFSSAMQGIVGGPGALLHLLQNHKDSVTFLVSLVIIFPLCLLRDSSLVEKTSVAKIATVVAITFILVHTYFSGSSQLPVQGTTVYEDWFTVKPNLLPSFESLRPEYRDIKHWKRVSTLCVLLCVALGVCMGLTVYVTFWGETTSIMLQLYPVTMEINFAKILVCLFAILTLPLPFLAAREMIVISIPRKKSIHNNNNNKNKDSPTEWWLQSERQLTPALHVTLTCVIWFVSTVLAILAPSLNDILNVGGCFSGSLIAYILPSLFHLALKGYTNEACFLLLFGLVVGIVGTFFALRTMLAHLGMI